MEVLETLEVSDAGRIELCVGDLTAMRGEDAVDLLVVSAFPDDYLPSRSSLVGALAGIGVSVAELASDKLDDLRSTSSCWLSHPIPDGREALGFGQLLCYEPHTSVAAAETVGDVFRALVPFVGGSHGVRTVAMPILASGNQSCPAAEMLAAILDAATGWMGMKLPLAQLRIVVRPGDTAEAQQEWARWRELRRIPAQAGGEDPDRPYDVFVSYARVDAADVADQIVKDIVSFKSSARVFLDRNEINPGASWQQVIYDCLNACRKVVIVLTPGFLHSKACEEELNLARLRHRESASGVLVPLYVRSAQIEQRAHLRMLDYADCREAHPDAIRRACDALARQL